MASRLLERAEHERPWKGSVWLHVSAAVTPRTSLKHAFELALPAFNISDFSVNLRRKDASSKDLQPKASLRLMPGDAMFCMPRDETRLTISVEVRA